MTRLKSVLAGALCAAQLGAGVPARAAEPTVPLLAGEVPTELYVEIGNELLYVDLTSFVENRGEVMSGSGSFTISVKRAALPRGAEVAAEFPFVEEVRLLGTDPSPETNTWWNVRAWTELIAWTVTATPHETISSYAVGRDRLSMRVPWSVLEHRPLPGDRVEVRLNEWVTALDADPDPLQPPLAERFVDGEAFVRSYVSLQRILERVLAHHAEQPGCAGPCLSCAAGGIASVASMLAIAASCTAAVATAGALTPACAAALLAHMGSNITAVSACGFCFECLNPGPPGGGEAGADEDEDPSGSCPEDYHECCGNMCCSDENPPAGCNEEA